MKYLILRKGLGQGCDYNIGYNMTWEIREFDGSSEKLVSLLTTECLYGDDDYDRNEEYEEGEDFSINKESITIGEAKIIPLNASNQIIEIDLNLAVKEHNEWCNKKQSKEKDLKEKQEYERLKNKFEGE